MSEVGIWQYHKVCNKKYLKGFATKKEETHRKGYWTIDDAVDAFIDLKNEGWDVGGIVCEYTNKDAETNGKKKRYTIRKGGVLLTNKWNGSQYRKPECWKYIGN